MIIPIQLGRMSSPIYVKITKGPFFMALANIKVHGGLPRFMVTNEALAWDPGAFTIVAKSWWDNY